MESGTDAPTVAPGYRFRRYRGREWRAIGCRGRAWEPAGDWVLRKCEYWQSGWRGCTLSDGKGGAAAPERGPGLPILRFPQRNRLSDCHYSTFLSRHGPPAPVNPSSPPLAANHTFNHGGRTPAWVLARGLRCHDLGLGALPAAARDPLRGSGATPHSESLHPCPLPGPR